MKRISRAIVSGIIVFGGILAGSAPAAEKTAVSSDGVVISYRVEGTGSPALVFVHGWSCDNTYWDTQVAAFSKTYKTVAVDLAGHGKSGLNRKAWTIPAFGEDVAAVIRAEKLDRAILIGHSMGGGVTVEAARLCPGKIIGIVGADTLHDLGGPPYPEAQMDGFLAPFKSDFIGAADDFVRQMLPKSADPALVERIAKDMSSAPAEVGIAALRATLGYTPAESLKSVRVPIMAINSDMYPVNVEGNRKVAASFDVKVMKGVGHFVMLEDAPLFNRLLEESIRGILAKN
ncbi:MAG: alpha/beta fold hydrolase [Candidatus Aminicenantales bacterium]